MKTAIIPIHTRVRGRARLRVKPPGRSPRLYARMEAQAQQLHGIRRVRVSTLTGSLLVYFDASDDWRSVKMRIDAHIVRSAMDTSPKPRH